MSDNPQPAALVFVSRHDVAETLVDAVRTIWIDGNTVRLELVVNRLDPPNPPAPTTGYQVTACRPVLTMPAALALLNGLKQMETAMLASGALKQVAPGTDSVN
ncbi:MAG TPA: hypothetical protein VG166_13700 [Caulobacteraceae bacterium]|jgi:hypothetical protein|nr:hypothetical protein [Caulobacteraceae bacterium]